MKMIERVARAIDKAAYDYLKAWHEESQKDPTKISFIGMADIPMPVMARAAIEAMREPTECMKEAFNKDYSSWFNEEIEDPDHLYKTMIDAALSEAEHENDI